MAQALRLAEENKDRVRADRLQQLHTLHNLALLLESGGLPRGEVVPTLRDSTLKQEADEIREVGFSVQHDMIE